MKVTHSIQPRDLVLVVIYLFGDREKFGRTSLQKASYLTSQKLKVDLGHRAYYYGPYSAAVEADADALVLSGLARESVEYLDFVNSSGFQATRYRYLISESGQARIDKLKEAHPEQYGLLESLVKE